MQIPASVEAEWHDQHTLGRLALRLIRDCADPRDSNPTATAVDQLRAGDTTLNVGQQSSILTTKARPWVRTVTVRNAASAHPLSLSGSVAVSMDVAWCMATPYCEQHPRRGPRASRSPSRGSHIATSATVSRPVSGIL